MYIHVAGPKSMRLGEVVSLRVTIFNRWTEEMDILISVKGSPDYNFMEIDRLASAVTGAEPVKGDHQVETTSMYSILLRNDKTINKLLNLDHTLYPENIFRF